MSGIGLFRGFPQKAFEILDRIRLAPHIGTYRAHRSRIVESIDAPFKAYRDELVISWVLPNQLPFETERNVFSRLHKNDFGAGGCHHHKWLAFYRQGRTRLRDLQLMHTLRHDSFSVGLHAGPNAPGILQTARRSIQRHPEGFVSLFDVAAESGGVSGYVCSKSDRRVDLSAVSGREFVAKGAPHMKRLWLGVRFSQNDVLEKGAGLLASAGDVLERLWPIYLFLLKDAMET